MFLLAKTVGEILSSMKINYREKNQYRSTLIAAVAFEVFLMFILPFFVIVNILLFWDELLFYKLGQHFVGLITNNSRIFLQYI